jgi:hypothetical protein
MKTAYKKQKMGVLYNPVLDFQCVSVFFFTVNFLKIICGKLLEPDLEEPGGQTAQQMGTIRGRRQCAGIILGGPAAHA